MLVIHQIKIPCGSWQSREELNHILKAKTCKRLRLSSGENVRIELLRHSIDARKKPDLFDVYSVGVISQRTLDQEKKTASRLHDARITAVEPVRYPFPPQGKGTGQTRKAQLTDRPVIVGFGPAGIFCALLLARAGYRPIVLERGRRMEERIRKVQTFWQTGQLDPLANAQFGEGGAGTFSDGKLNTNATDKAGRTAFILQTFVNAGAPEDILYEFHPHIGTDRLRPVIVKLREEIISLGGEIRFENRLDGLVIQNGAITGVQVTAPTGTYTLPSQVVVLAPGHSARDTLRYLYQAKVPLTAKPFAVGFRLSHPQAMINERMYGIADPKAMERLHLPAASYKLTARAQDGHGVYSFCMCPGGYIVNASSEEGALAVNGMSDYARDSARANSAIVITVGPEDYGNKSVLDGMYFQEKLERKAFLLAEGRIPAQWYPDFERGFTEEGMKITEAAGRLQEETYPKPQLNADDYCLRGACQLAPLHRLLPSWMSRDFIEGMHAFDRTIPGFAGSQALVCGIESRTSSPVRIERDENLESSIHGLYPCGEGAGFAGGITSAAIDGCKVAEAIAARWMSA